MSLPNPTYLTKCIYHNNSLVIYYSDPMSRYSSYSYLNPENYMLKNSDSNKMYMLKKNDTEVLEIHTNKCVKFIIANKNVEALRENTLLNAGFIYSSYINYIKSVDGAIHNFCTPFYLNSAAESIDISLGKITIINDSTISYTYYGNNSFSSSIFSNDFYLLTATKVFNPISISIANELDTHLLITFPPNSINLFTNMTLKTVSSPRTYDIFGRKILGNKEVSLGNIPTLILMPGETLPYSTSTLNYNYIIYISKDIPTRSYGYNDIDLTITGWIEFKSIDKRKLSHDDIITLTNIKTLSSIYLNLLPCTIILNNIVTYDDLFIGP